MHDCVIYMLTSISESSNLLEKLKMRPHLISAFGNRVFFKSIANGRGAVRHLLSRFVCVA